MRQRAIESYTTYDQHAMSIVGKAHDKDGKSYYIAKKLVGKKHAFWWLCVSRTQFCCLANHRNCNSKKHQLRNKFLNKV